ncbi:MAG: IclR family transcriptional regulator [Pseudomonadota bacterium]
MNQMNRSVLRAVTLLKVFQSENEWISASEISRRADLPFASTHRLLQTLEQIGAVNKGDFGAYRLGYLIVTLSQNVNVDDCLRRASQDLMSALSQKLNVSSLLGRLDGRMVTIIGKSFAPAIKHRFVAVGSQFGAHNLALGRVLLADLSLEEVDKVVNDLSTAAVSAQIPLNRSELIADLALIRKQEFAVERGQVDPGLGSVAVPVRDNDGRVFAALSASDELGKLTPDRIETLRKELMGIESSLRKAILPDSSFNRTRAARGRHLERRGDEMRRRAHLPEINPKELAMV